jgi:hypothetical protein
MRQLPFKAPDARSAWGQKSINRPGFPPFHILIRSLRPAAAPLWPGRRLGALPPGAAQGIATLGRDGIPDLPRDCVFLVLANSFDPLVQAG